MYSAKQKKLRGTGRSKRRFVQLWTNVKRSAAYHGLSLGARCALIELLDKYTGINNGMIPMSVRDLRDRLNCRMRAACNFLHELDDAGLARPTKIGAWRGRVASEWRLTFYRCDLTGDFPVTQWEPRPEPQPEPEPKHKPDPLTNAERQRRFRQKRRNENRNDECTTGSAEVHQGKRKRYVSAPREAQKRNSSIKRNGPSAPREAHIHIYQRNSETIRARKLAWLHRWNGAKIEAPAVPSAAT
jgi:hypothetical protein